MGKLIRHLRKVELLKANLTDEEKSSKLQGLYDYIKRNKRYVVNYEERQQINQTYTSQVEESHNQSLMLDTKRVENAMEEGAHNVLQIRAMITSNEWERKWQQTVLSALGAVA